MRVNAWHKRFFKYSLYLFVGYTSCVATHVAIKCMVIPSIAIPCVVCPCFMRAFLSVPLSDEQPHTSGYYAHLASIYEQAGHTHWNHLLTYKIQSIAVKERV